MFANQLPYQHYIDCVTFIIFRWVTESMVTGFTQPVNKYQPSAKNNSELYFPVYIIFCSAINASKHMTRYGRHALTLHFAIIGYHNRNCFTPMFTMIISVNVLSSAYKTLPTCLLAKGCPALGVIRFPIIKLSSRIFLQFFLFP